MLVLKIACRNLFRHTRRSLLLAIMIFSGVVLLFTASAIFESAAQGLETSFSGSLTGDFVLAANTENTISIFGNEMPLVTDYEPIPPLPEYAFFSEYLALDSAVEAWTPVITAAVRLETELFRSTVPVFGIDPKTYFSVCSDIAIVEGNPEMLEAGKGCIFLNTVIVKKIEEFTGKKPKIGDIMQMSIYSNGAFRIRKAIFAGVHRYVNEVQPFDKIILADPLIIREMLNYSQYSVMLEDSGESGQDTEEEVFSVEDLFLGTETDITVANSGDSLIDTVELELGVEPEARLEDNSTWSFILVSARKTAGSNLERQLNLWIRENGSDVKILGWKTAAGFTAQMAFALQSAFTVGIIFIIIGAVLVIMNGLVISVLERKSEIGTMRAVGATKSFISRLFIMETLLLVICSTLAGIMAGVLVCLIVNQNGITLQNNLLITLFGGKLLFSVISIKLILIHLLSAVVVSVFAWIYPVCIALRIQPVYSMVQE